MKRHYSILSLLALILMFPVSANAEVWNYDFEDFGNKVGTGNKKKAIEVELNGLQWHMCGVASTVEGADFMIGKCGMKLYGDQDCSWKAPEEFTNFTLATKRSIGKFSFTCAPNPSWAGSDVSQVAWIVQYSIDGITWTTIGDEFKTFEKPMVVERNINNPSALVRIVRADYQTYDFTKGLGYSYILNVDDMEITDFTGTEVPELYASVNSIDFGELQKGVKSEKTFTLTHKNIADPITIATEGPDAAAFSMKEYTLSENGTDELTLVCNPYHKGYYNAALVIKAGDLKINIDLKAKAIAEEGVKFSGGAGTEADPYQISCKEDLFELSNDVEKEMNTYEGTYFLVTNDINMENVDGYRSIGNNFDRMPEASDCVRPFSGIFDGGNHTIYNMKGQWEDYGFVGLFGIIRNATVKNITVAKSNIYGDFGVAAIVGTAMEDCLISNCHVAEDVIVENRKFYAAGICSGLLVGGVNGSVISDCTNKGNIHGCVGYTAGIVATNSQNNAMIQRCGNYGEIVDDQLHVAGIIANTSKGITIEDCYNVGNIQKMAIEGAENALGAGILACGEEVTSEDNINIFNCYNLGTFNVVGYSMHPIYEEGVNSYTNVTINNCYFSEEINSYDFSNVTSLPLADMKSQMFADLLNNERENGCWVIKEGVNNGYPVPEGLGSVTAVESVEAGANGSIAFNSGRIEIANVKAGAEVIITDIAGRLVNKVVADAQGFVSIDVTSMLNGAYIVNVDGKAFKFAK